MKNFLLILRKDLMIILLVFSLALFLRVYKLGSIPHTFHEDEVLSGYVGRYIIENGYDLYGNKWPLLYFDKFGDYYIIGPIYLSGLATLIFGVNEFATRFPHAFFGAISVIPMFYFVREIFKNKKIAFISSFLLAVTPWHIVLSRTTTEGIIGTTIFLTSIIYLLKSIKNQNLIFLVISLIFSFFGYFIYHPFRLYPPMIFILCFFLFFDTIKKSRQYLFIFLFLSLTLSLLTFFISQTSWGKGRFNQTSIFSPLSGVIFRINDLRSDTTGISQTIERIFHNKLTGFTREFVNQYFKYFSANFLFINGWEKLRYHIPEQGMIYLILIVPLLITLSQLDKLIKAYKKNFIFLVILFLISPLPASLTVVEAPNPHRSLFMLIPLIALLSYGIFYLYNSKKIFSFLIKIVFLFFFITEFIFFIHHYFAHADLYSSFQRNDGQKEISKFAIKNLKKYNHIFLPAEAAMSWYYLFYSKDFNPSYSKKFRLDSRIDSTGKIFYIENSCPTTVINPSNYTGKKILIIDRPNCQSDINRWRFLRYIHGRNPLLKYKVFEN